MKHQSEPLLEPERELLQNSIKSYWNAAFHHLAWQTAFSPWIKSGGLDFTTYPTVLLPKLPACGLLPGRRLGSKMECPPSIEIDVELESRLRIAAFHIHADDAARIAGCRLGQGHRA
jgi:hypothetical protein